MWDGSEYGGEDAAFMQALVVDPALIAVFAAHQHGNDWRWKWNGTVSGMSVVGTGKALCFGRHTGYGGYGQWWRGSRQILLDAEDLKDQAVRT